MNAEILKTRDFYRTPSLSLAAAVLLFYPLEAIDRPPNEDRAYFLFKRDENIDRLIESYWSGELKVPPQAYFNALRAIKARLYGEE